MLAEERFALILEQLNEQRTVTVQQLCEALHTSESTIRRDLTELDRQGRLTKVHGGATLPDSRFLADEPTMEAKETLAVAEKRSIAAAAAALIAAEDFVFIDAGTTTLELVRALTGVALKATYVTNGVAHARLLAQKASVTAKSSASRRKKRSTVQPTVSSAAAYSANVGAVTSALRGRLAHTSRKIRSAAPLPQRSCSAGTPSCAASFSRRARQKGSG